MKKYELEEIEEILWSRIYKEWIRESTGNPGTDEKSFRAGYNAAVWVLLESYAKVVRQKTLF